MADNDQTPNPTPETKPETPPAPSFDADALAAQVADKLKDQFRQAPPPQRAPEPPRPAAAPDPVADLLNPYIQPEIARARLDALAAEDKADFYTDHRDIEPEDRAEIERRFSALKQQGVPFKRSDIYNHMLGERIDKEVEKRIEKRSKQVDRAANAAATVGAGSPDKGAPQVRDAHAMSTGDLEKALAGQSF